MTEKLSRNEYRTLIVVYKLAGGKAGIPVDEKDIFKEIQHKNVYGMTDEEFTAYHKQILQEVKYKKN